MTILIVCLQQIASITKRKQSYIRKNDFFSQNEDFDVLYFGNSHIINGVFPMDLYNKYGIISYNMANHGITLVTTYYNILLSCNSIGIKIYNFINNEYKLVKVIPMFLDVENIIQIRVNNFLVIHHHYYSSGGCFPVTSHKFALSLFDLKSNKIINKIFEQETEREHWGRSNYKYNYFLMGDNFIYQICNIPEIFDEYNETDKIKNKTQALSLNYNIYNIKTGNNIMNLKTSFNLISYFKDNLIFAQDNESLNVCYFENNIFYSIYKFDFNCSKLCILKNNDIIIFGEKNIWEETKRDRKSVV